MSQAREARTIIVLVECDCHHSVVVRCYSEPLVVTNAVYFRIVIESRREDLGETVGAA